MACFLRQEVINVVRLQRYYLKDTETWIKWCVYLNIMFIVIHPTDDVLRYNMALCILLSWTELLLIIAKYPAWGIYVLMFATVAGTILKVSILQISTIIMLKITNIINLLKYVDKINSGDTNNYQLLKVTLSYKFQVQIKYSRVNQTYFQY